MMNARQKIETPLKGILFISIILLSSSCVYDKEFTYINDQIIALNNRMTRLQESVDQKIDSKVDSKLHTGVDPQIEDIKSTQAETMAEIDRLKTEITGLKGRVQDNEYLIKQAVEKDLNQQDSIRSDLDKLKGLLARIEKLEILVKQQNEYLGLEPTGARKETGPGETAGEASRGSPEQGKGSAEEEAYNRSLALFREEKYEAAIDGFHRFLDLYPKSDLADNAQFWIGESYMALKQYDKAILAYQDVIEKYPKANKVPNAMLRQVAAWMEIDDKRSARAVLKNLIKEFPDSNEAKLARSKLNQLE